MENASGTFLLCRECGPDAVPNVEHVHNMMAFIHSVNNSVDVRLLPKRQVTKLLLFGDDQATTGKSIQTINCFGETIEPSERMLGSTRFDRAKIARTQKQGPFPRDAVLDAIAPLS